MEKFYLSKIEWLTEWFMQLFFDPMYFFQPEKVHSSDTANNVKRDTVNSIHNQIWLVEKKIMQYKKLWNANDPVRKINGFFMGISIRIMENLSDAKKWSIRALFNAKSTLNNIQSAFDILWYGLSFQ